MRAIQGEIARATLWLQEQAERTPFGQVSITLVLHDGRVARLEKSLILKEQPDDGRENDHSRR
jgi:hypothetical protein